MPATGWKLAPHSREFLVDTFPPRWRDLIGDHVMLDAHADQHAPPSARAEAAVVGHADDGEGLEALVVEIDGSSDRPDGSVFHITWSIEGDKGREPIESNALLARREWRKLSAPIAIELIPAPI